MAEPLIYTAAHPRPVPTRTPAPPRENWSYPVVNRFHFIGDKYSMIITENGHVAIFEFEIPTTEQKGKIEFKSDDPSKIMELPSHIPAKCLSSFQDKPILDHRGKRIIINNRDQQCIEICSSEDCSHIRTIDYSHLENIDSIAKDLRIAFDERSEILMLKFIDHESAYMWNLRNFIYLGYRRIEHKYAKLFWGDFISAINNQCIAYVNRGRFVRFSSNRYMLEAFRLDKVTHQHKFGDKLCNFIFDKNRGIFIVESNMKGIFVIKANEWLPDTFEWKPHRHGYAPPSIQKSVLILTMIRSLEFHLVFSLLPNELLFQIFRSL